MSERKETIEPPARRELTDAGKQTEKSGPLRSYVY